MDPLTIGLGLAKLVPKVWNLFGGDDDDVEKAEKLIGIAQNLTGYEGENALAAIESNPELQLKFKKLAMEDKYFKEKLDAEDRKNARDMYKANGSEQADKIADKIIGQNLYYIIGIALAQILALSFVPDMSQAVVVVIGNVCGWIIKGLLDERLQVTSFYYGSSLGSKYKDK